MPERGPLPHAELPESYRESLKQLQVKAEIIGLFFKLLTSKSETLEPDVLEKTWEQAIALIPDQMREEALAYIGLPSNYSGEPPESPPFGEFLGYLNECKEDLKIKQKIVDSERAQSKEEWAKAISSMSRRPIHQSEIVRIVKGPFSISLVLTPEAFQASRKNISESHHRSVGFHIRDNAFNIICQQEGVLAEYDEDRFIDHENIHNILDTQGRMRDLSAEFKRNPNLSGSKYIDCLQEEILAHLSNFETDLETYLLEDFTEFTSRLSTAGAMAYDFVEELSALGMRGRIVTTEFKEAFVRICNIIYDTLLASRSLYPKEGREVEALLFILKPSQYKHIPAYLDFHFGPQLRERVEKIKLCRYFFTLDEIVNVTRIIQEPEMSDPVVELNLKHTLKFKLDLIFEDLEYNISQTRVTTPAELREYCRCLAMLEAYCDVTKNYAEKFFQIFVAHFLLQEEENNFANLNAFYDAFSPTETALFEKILAQELSHLRDDLSLDSEIKLAQSPLGQFMKRIRTPQLED